MCTIQEEEEEAMCTIQEEEEEEDDDDDDEEAYTLLNQVQNLSHLIMYDLIPFPLCTSVNKLIFEAVDHERTMLL